MKSIHIDGEDRRVRRTKSALVTTLAEILLEKPRRHITVTELAERADINRSTFYSYYTDINDLYGFLEDYFIHKIVNLRNTMLDNYYEAEDAFDRLYFFFIKSLEYIEDNGDIMEVLLRPENRNSMVVRMVDFFDNEDTQSLKFFGESLDPQFAAAFITAGTCEVIYRWLADGKEDSISDMAQAFVIMVTEEWPSR